jgi:hypothetical protein
MGRMTEIALPDWMTLLGTLVAFATFGWTVWKEVRERRLANMMRISAATSAIDEGHQVNIAFEGAEDHTRYAAVVRLKAPRSAELTTSKQVVVQSQGIAFGLSRAAPADRMGREMTVLLEETRGTGPTVRVGVICIVDAALDVRGKIRVAVMDVAAGRCVARRTFHLSLDQ